MDNQHKKISGYRDLSQAEINMMNDVKALEAKWNALVDRIAGTRGSPEGHRQIAIAKTEGEHAFMRAVRAIALPERAVDNG